MTALSRCLPAILPPSPAMIPLPLRVSGVACAFAACRFGVPGVLFGPILVCMLAVSTDLFAHFVDLNSRS